MNIWSALKREYTAVQENVTGFGATYHNLGWSGRLPGKSDI
jgi:hypothetical protein